MIAIVNYFTPKLEFQFSKDQHLPFLCNFWCVINKTLQKLRKTEIFHICNIVWMPIFCITVVILKCPHFFCCQDHVVKNSR